MTDTPSPTEKPRHTALSVAFGVFVFCIFAGALVGALPMARGAALMPMVISSLGLGLCLVVVVRTVLLRGVKLKEGSGIDIDEMTDVAPLRAARYAGWMVLYVFGLWLFGLFIATISFAVLFLRIERRASLVSIVIVTGITVGTAVVLGQLLNIRWPAGLLLP